MFEDQETTYQSGEPEVTDTEPIESSEPTETDTTPEPEMEFDEIKYNKEAVKIPASERQKYLQLGYHYDQKVSKELDTYKQQSSAVEKLAQMSGYTNTQEFLQAVEQAEQQRLIQEEAQRMGVDESTYQQYFQPVNDRLQSYERELETLRTERAQREIENTVQQLRGKYEDFDTYADMAFNMVLTGEVRDLERAYRLASMDDKYASMSKQKEQEVLARVSGRDGRQVLPSTDKPGQVKFDPSSMSFDEIQELSRRARSGERITF